jgi:hypothetical protein
MGPPRQPREQAQPVVAAQQALQVQTSRQLGHPTQLRCPIPGLPLQRPMEAWGEAGWVEQGREVEQAG